MSRLRFNLRHAFAGLLAALAAALASQVANAETFSMKRGISMELWTTWPSPDQWENPAALFPFPEWRRNVSTQNLADLGATGYDVIRLPVDPGVLLDPSTERHRARLYAEIETTIDMIHKAGLSVIVDLHTIPGGDAGRPGAIEPILAEPEKFDAYEALVGEMAERLTRADPSRTAFELINEPIIDCDAPSGERVWPRMIERLYRAARDRAPDLTLVLTGGCWGDAAHLDDLPTALTDDPKTLFTFHSYAPFLLTHQGATWAGDVIVHVTGLPYPPDRLGAAELDRRIDAIKAVMRRDATPQRAREMIPYLDELIEEIDTADKLRAVMAKPFDQAAAFVRARSIAPERIFLGEFGMIHSEWNNPYAMPTEWRIAYLKDMRTLAEENGFAWSVWGYSGAFGMVTGFGGEPIPGAPYRALLED